MDEYINKTEILFEMANSLIPQSMDITRAYAIAKDIIKKAPVVDVKPVVHGMWRILDSGDGWVEVECSACNHKSIFTRTSTAKFCPNCGADMRGVH